MARSRKPASVAAAGASSSLRASLFEGGGAALVAIERGPVHVDDGIAARRSVFHQMLEQAR
jgi:hypothetical protein